MSTEEKEKVEATVSPNPYTEGAQTLVQQIRKMRDVIPKFTIPERKRATSRLTAAASVPPEFVELTATAIANENALVRGDSPTPTHMRDLVSYADAYDPLPDELEAFASFLRHSTAAARYEAGLAALNIYSLAQRLAKQVGYAGLVPYVADMRRALGRFRKATPENAAKKAAQQALKANAKAAKAAAKAAPPKTS